MTEHYAVCIVRDLSRSGNSDIARSYLDNSIGEDIYDLLRHRQCTRLDLCRERVVRALDDLDYTATQSFDAMFNSVVVSTTLCERRHATLQHARSLGNLRCELYVVLCKSRIIVGTSPAQSARYRT